jgi:hypothetical protein
MAAAPDENDVMDHADDTTRPRALQPRPAGGMFED